MFGVLIQTQNYANGCQRRGALIFARNKSKHRCETFASFQQDTHKLLPLRVLTLCHVCAALPLRCNKKAPSPGEKMLRLPGKIDGPAAQSAAPATKNRHASCDTLLKYCACHAKRTRYVNACPKTQENNATICDEMSHFVSTAQR